MDAIKIHDLFDLTHTRAEKMLAACEYSWEALSQIGETVLEIGRTLDLGAYDHPAADVWIAKSATVAATASITGPCVIGEKTEVRPGAFIRGNVLVGDGAVVGNSCELKNCILSALSVYRRNGDAWKQLQRQAMEQDFSWKISAKKYLDIYQKLMG